MKLALFLLAFANMSHADVLGSVPELTPPHGTTILCKNDGGLFAFNTVDKRIWQGEPDADEGLELKIDQFNILRCPLCYQIEARLPFADAELKYRFELRGERDAKGSGWTPILKAEFYGPSNDQVAAGWQELPEMKCERVPLPPR